MDQKCKGCKYFRQEITTIPDKIGGTDLKRKVKTAGNLNMNGENTLYAACANRQIKEHEVSRGEKYDIAKPILAPEDITKLPYAGRYILVCEDDTCKRFEPRENA